MPQGVAAPAHFSVKEDLSSVAQRWKKWKLGFGYYLEALGIKDKVRQRALLLHASGPEVQNIFSTLPGTLNDYDQSMQALDKHQQLKLDP